MSLPTQPVMSPHFPSRPFLPTFSVVPHSDPKLWALEAPVGALVHKTTYAPMIYTALYVMFLMRANPLLGQVGGGWALEISPNGSIPFHRPKKVSISRAQPPPTCPSNGSAHHYLKNDQASSKGHIIQGAHCPRDKKSQTKRSVVHHPGIYHPVTILLQVTHLHFLSLWCLNEPVERTGWPPS